MRKLIYVELLIFVILVIHGCQKDLQEHPRTFVDPATFFTNADSYEQAVEGIYSGLPGLYSSNSMMMREMFSDIYGVPSTAEQVQPTYENNHQPFFYNVRREWANDYGIVKNANFILSYLPSATVLSTTEQTQLTAEARFLRAFAYFQLVQFYGDIPLRTKPLTDYTEAQLPKSSQTDVYNFILADLTYAEANLPSVASTQGRVYSLVATALLSKVYLTMAGTPLNQTQYYQNARDKALVVINSNRYSLVSDYSKIFHNTGYTTESIWEQLFNPALGGNSIETQSSTASGFIPILLPATWFISSFPDGDQRKLWGIQQNFKVGGMTIAPFFQKFVNNTNISAGLTPSSVINGYTIPFLRLGEMYLIAAEAENELNGPANAYQYINKIRMRARVDKSNLADVPDLSVLTKDSFRQALYMERKWELYQEGSTWFDLKRTNTLGRIQTIRGGGLVNPIGTYNLTWYIPDQEILVNPISQNSAYK